MRRNVWQFVVSMVNKSVPLSPTALGNRKESPTFSHRAVKNGAQKNKNARCGAIFSVKKLPTGS
jgi:hypothetical protein